MSMMVKIKHKMVFLMFAVFTDSHQVAVEIKEYLA